MTTGANSSILGSSPNYKVQTIFLIILVLSLISSNLLLIPTFGITGAAVGGAISLTILNILRFSYLWYKHGLQPFNYKFILIAIIGITAFYITTFIPILPEFMLDILVRSSILTILFALPIYLLKISPDINDKANGFLKMVRIIK